jgi:hypothetical protein
MTTEDNVMDNEIHQQIAKLAFEIYENSDRGSGKDMENWLTAEKIVLSKQKRLANFRSKTEMKEIEVDGP